VTSGAGKGELALGGKEGAAVEARSVEWPGPVEADLICS